eukprot:9472947-Pyramimonas_sp.AAC.1
MSRATWELLMVEAFGYAARRESSDRPEFGKIVDIADGIASLICIWDPSILSKKILLMIVLLEYWAWPPRGCDERRRTKLICLQKRAAVFMIRSSWPGIELRTPLSSRLSTVLVLPRPLSPPSSARPRGWEREEEGQGQEEVGGWLLQTARAVLSKIIFVDCRSNDRTPSLKRF